MHDRFKQLRKSLGCTQRLFAEQLGLKQNSIAQIEMGLRNPSNSVINNICKTFGVNEQWLRTGEGEMFLNNPEDELAERLNLTGFEKLFLTAYMSLPKQQREDFCNGMYDGMIKAIRGVDQQTQPKKEEPWEREARLLEEEAAALRKGGRKCSALPPTKEA